MQIKFTVLQDGKQPISREFTEAKDALEYLESISPADEVVEEVAEAPAEEDMTAPINEAPAAFTNDQRFVPGQHVMFHQHVGEYAGEHVIVEEREEEKGYSYRTDRSGDTFIHAHWFAPVTE